MIKDGVLFVGRVDVSEGKKAKKVNFPINNGNNILYLVWIIKYECEEPLTDPTTTRVMLQNVTPIERYFENAVSYSYLLGLAIQMILTFLWIPLYASDSYCPECLFSWMIDILYKVAALACW